MAKTPWYKRIFKPKQKGISAPIWDQLRANSIGAFNRAPYPRLGARGLLQAYESNGWLRSIIDLISSEVATAQWRVLKPTNGPVKLSKSFEIRQKQIKAYVQSHQLVEVPQHELLTILRSPSATMSGLAAMKLAQTHLDLVGESFLHLRRTVDGRILGFEVIPPTSVMSTPTVDNQFFQIQTQSGLVSVPATEVLWVKHMSPIDPTGRGVGIAMSLGGELQITEHISESLKSIFARGGMGTTVVSVAAADQNQDSTDIAEDISKNFDGNVIGPHQQGKIVVLPGKISATTINNDLKQLEVVSIQKSIQDHIRQVFAIPPEILGDTSSSNRSTAEAAEYHLQAYSILPRLEFLCAELNARLVPLVDSGAILDFDDPRPSSLDVCMGLMTNGNTAHAFTQNEVRRLTGLAPTPGGDTNLLPPPGSKPVSKTPENNK